jgi:hypothetical protein
MDEHVVWGLACCPAGCFIFFPRQEFGTPQQDAERRDFTMNALFYNVNTAQIEDFTGQVAPLCPSSMSLVGAVPLCR